MISEKMYVRIASDFEDSNNPRIFICGQVISIDNFTETAMIKIHDPFNNLQYFPDLKSGVIEEQLTKLNHCVLFDGTRVIYKRNECEIISHVVGKQNYFWYYIQIIKTKEVLCVPEKNIVAAFNNGRISPLRQLANYELQNPMWYLCRSLVSKTLNILDNSIAGFKDLAGCKIFLLPHQVNTIMRCFQEEKCRFMLADEVGMGKTIEALSIYKLFIKNKYQAKSLILVPDSLVEQWKIEMFLKFNILPGEDSSNNTLVLKTISQLSLSDMIREWDFVIIDEVHNYLNSDQYEEIHSISRNAKNILMLSATPVQQREEEYLQLLRLLSPERYDDVSLNSFINLLNKQKRIVQQTTNALEDLEDYYEELESVLDDGDLPEDSEECRDIFEDLVEEIEDLSEIIDDDHLGTLIDAIDFDSDGYGVTEFKSVLSYISANFQIENSIIRNRRKLLEVDEDEDDKSLPVRQLIEISYDLDLNSNFYERQVYRLLISWLTEHKDTLDDYVLSYVKPILGAFFSSVYTLKGTLMKLRINDEELNNAITKWYEEEKYILSNAVEIIENPDDYHDYCNNRLIKVLDFLYEEIDTEKVVLFTDYSETFDKYKEALIKVFGEDRVCSFSKQQDSNENELNAYRFQNNTKAQFLLCDPSGGEGRNFQCADYIVHIDLPWDANTIEQRIGRLDRLERDPERIYVNSVVVHTNDSFENELFEFWNKGLKVFTQSLSGMEIIMKDINAEIIKAVEEDIEYQLANKIPEIIELSEKLSEEINTERNFDATAIIYRPMYIELTKLISYYSSNENSIFTQAMSTWAGMAGFKGEKSGKIIRYAPKGFSYRSAIKSLLMPPRFEEYMISGQNQFITNVSNMYDSKIKRNDRSIRGTFDRKKAIENDYLHFFAPGDAIFDCIVDNAMNTCKGQASSFAFKSQYDWKGFVFTFKVQPDVISLLKENKSIYLLNSYRTYLCNKLLLIPVAIENTYDIEDEKIVREFNSFISKKFNVKYDSVSFGKRSNSAGFLSGTIVGKNIEWFREYYPEEKWKTMIHDAYNAAVDKVKDEYKSKTNLKGAYEEMQRQLASRKANLGYYGIDNESISKMEEQNKLVMKILKNSKLVLDSACFVWMVK